MIKTTNITSLLKVLGFTLDDGSVATWVKTYPNHGNYKIWVDVEAENIDYGKKVRTQDKTTCNFKAAENFVVFECVNRLLEKGYKPENIILEKRWATGHGTSGKLDILVTRDNGNAHMMIECKTSGAEFDKAFKRMQKDGGQLFTYFQQDTCADILMLYASNCNSKGKLSYQNEIIKIEDDYRQTSNVADFYERWNKLTKNNGIFDDWVIPYDFESKALTPRTLKEITQKDSSFIFNQFLEILRHNVVSDKPNAFNKIFTLFLCKIYDEWHTKNDEELAFQWFFTSYTYEGISYPQDNNVTFQKRLTDLYKKGMKAFLDKDVTDISDAEFNKKYGKLDNALRNQLLDELVEIRLKKNNEFAFKEVYDDESFEDNAKVVKEVVELLQGYKIRYAKKQQYLSDFFEMLLTTGLKQESGQFFTPVPIAQFIIKSLPLDKLVKEKLTKSEKGNYLPTMIDYAAGSGHFITEGMHVIQNIINSLNPDDYISDTAKKIKSWKTDHFDWAYDYVYGIEKDYRLVKVGKVGCYLHGDGLAQIIHSDGLADFGNTSDYKGLLQKTSRDNPQENRQFDVVISNPPYSVSAFKNNASKYYGEKDFELYSTLTDQSSEIECLFIERTKQLLKEGGLAGVILPSSILSNTGIYTKAREIIFKYFEIVGIAELGSNTFMATGTNTVTLFLRRRDNYTYYNTLSSVQKSFEIRKDVAVNQVQAPLQKYVEYVWDGTSIEDYWTLLAKSPNKSVQNHEIFKDYKKKIKTKDEDALLGEILVREIEKASYFILALGQKVVVVKSGEKNEEKKFLGYEFSNRRGSEGIHPTLRGKTIDECTKLFDPNRFDNPEKASTYLYKAFTGDFETTIDDSLMDNISRHNLIDMMTFDRESFDMTVSLTTKKKVNFENIWKTENIVALETISEIRKGTAITKANTELGDIPVIAGGKEPAYYHNKSNRDPNIITVSASGANAGFVNYFCEPIFASDCSTIKSLNETKISTKLLYYFIKHLQSFIFDLSRGQAQPHVYPDDLKKLKVPLPSIDVQRKIIAEIQEIEKKEQKVLREIEEFKNGIVANFENLKFDQSTLGNIASFKNGLNYSRKSIGDLISIVGVKDFQDRFSPDLNMLDKVQIDGKLSNDYELRPNDLLVVRSNGSANLVGRFLFISKLNAATSFSGFTIRIRPDLEKVEPKFLCYYLKNDIVQNKLTQDSKGANIKSLNQDLLSSIKIPLPPLKEQKKLVTQIEEIEVQIAELQEKLAKMPIAKDAILKKYL